jgi:CBS domain-containing protein
MLAAMRAFRHLGGPSADCAQAWLAIRNQGGPRRFVTGLRRKVKPGRLKGMSILNCTIESHVAWKSQIQHQIQEGQTLDDGEIANTRTCDLGKWIYGEGLQFNRMPSYEALCYFHDNFHRAAAEVVRFSNAGARSKAISLMEDDGVFAKSSQKLIWAITKLKNALAQQDQGGRRDANGINQLLKDKRAKHLHSIEGHTLICDAIQFMRVHKTHYLVVFNGREYLGIFSERWFIRHCLHKGVDAFSLPVSVCIDAESFPVEPNASLEHYLTLMMKTERWQLPVIDNNRFLGVITIGDIIARMMSEDGECRFLSGGYAEALTLLRAI